MIKLRDIIAAAKEKLPTNFAERSGLGSRFIDALLKPMNAKLLDDTRVGCRRKGLKVTFPVGTKKREGRMGRLDISKDPVVMLNAALQAAAQMAGIQSQVTDSETLVVA